MQRRNIRVETTLCTTAFLLGAYGVLLAVSLALPKTLSRPAALLGFLVTAVVVFSAIIVGLWWYGQCGQDPERQHLAMVYLKISTLSVVALCAVTLSLLVPFLSPPIPSASKWGLVSLAVICAVLAWRVTRSLLTMTAEVATDPIDPSPSPDPTRRVLHLLSPVTLAALLLCLGRDAHWPQPVQDLLCTLSLLIGLPLSIAALLRLQGFPASPQPHRQTLWGWLGLLFLFTFLTIASVVGVVYFGLRHVFDLTGACLLVVCLGNIGLLAIVRRPGGLRQPHHR